MISARFPEDICFPKADAQAVELAGGIMRRRVRARGAGLMVVEVEFEKGAVGPVHSHPHDQCTYVVEGAFEFGIEDASGAMRTCVVRKGDSLFLPGGGRHGTVCLEKGYLLDIFNPQREDFL